MKSLFFALTIYFLQGPVFSQESEFKGCELGWFRYKNEKCVNVLDVPTVFREGQEYCRTAYGADILNITNEDERLFWSFHLMRYSNLSSDVWLDNKMFMNLAGITLKQNECLALRSRYSTAPGGGKVGEVFIRQCTDEASTVCEIRANKKLSSRVEPKDFNPNEEFVANHRLKYSNGTDSDLYSGVYYLVTSKFKNTSFSNGILGNGECELQGYQGQDCGNIHIDEELRDKYGNYYMFTKEENNLVQIRRFISDKLLVYEPDKYLGNFECFEDGLTKLGKEVCADALDEYRAVSKWRIDPYKNTSYYVIRSNYGNLTLGAMEYKIGGKKAIGFGLYEPVVLSSNLHDKFLFKIEILNYTIDVDLHSVEFDQSLDKIVAGNKKQISIIDTAIITNDSPASLVHEVSSTKELTETFSTSYGQSQEFMDSFVNRDELGASSTGTSTKTKSLTDTASEAISQSLSSSMSSSDSSSSDSHQSSSSGSEVSGSANVGFSFLGASAGGGKSWSSESGSSQSSSHTTSSEQSQSQTSSNEKSKSKTATDEESKSKTMDQRTSKETTKQSSTTSDKRTEEGGSRSRSYSIQKTVNLPPYSAVKISSYANWVDDMTIAFRLNLKFTVRSFRRRMNGEGTNAWRTMDAAFVKHLVKLQKFPGDIVRSGYDAVYGQIKGHMKASVGLESVFMATETDLKKST